ncbi:dTDP-4-dehydrorhamnose 3,5-epimerase [bacterium]|nr:dTDP-4-dehydrorhamnose 3,5-epimerase [bacterium]
MPYLLLNNPVIQSPHGEIHKLWSETEGGLGEAYISRVSHKAVSAWKRHVKMVSRIKIVRGRVLFVFPSVGGETFSLVLDDSSSELIEISPNQWFGFQGLERNNSILNLASIEHDPNEVERLPIGAFMYDWRS